MSAIQHALQLYGPDFARIHGAYLEHGFTYSEPEMLGLARPCDSSDYTKWIDAKDADAWWVELVIGPRSLPILLSKIPFDLPKIGWRRDFKYNRPPRFYNFYKVRDTINGLN